jgi:hypothetical protein
MNIEIDTDRFLLKSRWEWKCYRCTWLLIQSIESNTMHLCIDWHEKLDYSFSSWEGDVAVSIWSLSYYSYLFPVDWFELI